VEAALNGSCDVASFNDVTNDFLHGVVHEAREDIQVAVRAAADTFALWQKLTPLGRNEFICWIDDAKQPQTRARRIERACEELREGEKAACCWVGCIHRPDKAPSRWQQAVLIDREKRRDR